MRLGIDFGTTRTRVAAAIRGNYPLVSFTDEEIGTTDWYPSLIATCGSEVRCGLAAAAVRHDPDWTILPSIKRLLGEQAPEATLQVGDVRLPILEWLTRLLTALHDDLRAHGNVDLRRTKTLQVVVGTPANANGTQRFLTLEAFRQAGFALLGMLNEPSAAGLEYAHRSEGSGLTKRRERVVAFDLGGGTFDAAVVDLGGSRHEVVASDGIPRLGGDDFDALLLGMALEDAAFAAAAGRVSRSRLLEVCREAKEGLTPQARRIALDFGRLDPDLPEVAVSAAAFAERCEPLIRRTLEATEAAIRAAAASGAAEMDNVAAVYLVGGGCELPALGRMLRERFGRRVQRSPYPAGATAIGLAIAADGRDGSAIRERFTRHFGVWREAESGQAVAFDVLFPRGTPLPAKGEPPLSVSRRYRPRHNLGRYRFLECSQLGPGGEPAGDILTWREAWFPFVPELQEVADLAAIPVEPAPAAEEREIEEVYRCTAAGLVEVVIIDTSTGHSRTFRVR
jgi:molecular chaperone DnaK (HSP70)